MPDDRITKALAVMFFGAGCAAFTAGLTTGQHAGRYDAQIAGLQAQIDDLKTEVRYLRGRINER